MGKMKIRRISLLNFKGFEKLQLSFDSENVIILGGKNGYGKTTLFDALELLFSGRIQRMIDYKDYHNNRYGISQEEKPLVFNKHSDYVIVSAEIELGDARVVLQRKAKVSDMKNPVDFKAFGKLQIVENDGTERVLSDEDSKNLGIKELCQSYSFLNYLSQEEATTFLKQKEADRAAMLSHLFDLEKYETYLRKIKKVQKVLGDLLKEWNKEKQTAENSIKSLLSSGVKEKEDNIEYVQITAGQKCKWDEENPQLSYEEFNALLAEEGVFDKLTYLAQNMSEYQKFRRNLFVKQHSSEDEIHKLAFVAKYFTMTNEIKSYIEFQEKIVQPVVSLALSNIEKFSLNIPNDIRKCIANEVIDNLNNKLKTLKEQYKCFDNIQKVQFTILEMRNKLAKAIEENSPETHQCPLCGHDHISSERLLKEIDIHGELLRKQMENSMSEIQEQFNSLKKELQILVMEPITGYFASISITEDVCKEYQKLDVKQLSELLGIFKDKFQLSIDTTLAVEDIIKNIKRQLETTIQQYDTALDYQAMHQSYSSYGRYLKKEFLKEDFIQKKRQYLIKMWNKSKSEQLKIYERKKEYAKKTLDNIERRIGEFKSFQKDVQDAEKIYLGKLLSDIKILFYIYSGRIMQDNYFGRGLFIREKLDKNRVLITSSKSEHDEVDALFNMSSGQLVSLVVALTLSLNKLYSSVPFIAIDDPIQTMDDINLWGLIETLRHDFSDHFLLLSTHETDYGKLLEYKLKKWGIDTEFVEMSQLHKKQC